MMLPLALSISMPTPIGIYRVAYVLFGFSLIIFLHELGHFVVARACGVKCLAFSLGIGPRMFGWRKNGGLTFGPDKYDPEVAAKRAAKNKPEGETLKTLESDIPTSASDPSEGKTVHGKELGHTDYRISWLPLGGYVRMLGQDDMDPTKVSSDPRAFNNRPIWQRMCIVCAGVIMNLIFAAVAFSILFSPGMGVDFPNAELGGVAYNSPAWKAGLRMGDRIVEIDHKRPGPSQGFVEFTDMKIAGALASGNEDIQFKYVRPGVPGETEIFMRPVLGGDGFLGSPGPSAPCPASKSSPRPNSKKISTAAKPLSSDAARTDLTPATQLRTLRGGDILTSVDGKPVANYPEYYRLLQTTGPRPVAITALKNASTPSSAKRR